VEEQVTSDYLFFHTNFMPFFMKGYLNFKEVNMILFDLMDFISLEYLFSRINIRRMLFIFFIFVFGWNWKLMEQLNTNMAFLFDTPDTRTNDTIKKEEVTE